MKPALEAGQRTCNVERKHSKGHGVCIIEKSNKKALNEVKKKKLEEIIDMKDEHIHNQYL